MRINFSFKKINNNLIFELKNIFSVMLLYSKNKILNLETSYNIVRLIVCQQKKAKKEICSENNICENCFKIKNNNYFAFKNFEFSSSNIMSKKLVLEIISDITKTSLEIGASKIYLINNIEFSSVMANNVLLKILEELPSHVYIIFTTTNIDMILPTIKSRCQLINCFKQQLIDKNNYSDEYSDEQLLWFNLAAAVEFEYNENTSNKLQIVISILEEFIYNIENKINNELLVKKIMSLKEETVYFFKFLKLITYNKLFYFYFKKQDFNNHILEQLEKLWTINEVKKVSTILALSNEVINKLNSNVNLFLLINFFIIKVSDI